VRRAGRRAARRTLADVPPQDYRLRPLAEDDAATLAAAYRRNRDHLARWDPRRDEAFFTEEGQLADLRLKLDGSRLGLQDPWLLVHDGEDDAEVVGRVNLSNIVRGVFQSASVGYWVDARHTGRGLAVAMVEFALARAVDIGLHRVEAGTLVDNTASQAVLRRCGFEQYGVAERYLFIAGEWQDHTLYQRILHDQPLGDPVAASARSGRGAATR
jgi:ribosomal-protein-alanine N-acetyltransferase